MLHGFYKMLELCEYINADMFHLCLLGFCWEFSEVYNILYTYWLRFKFSENSGQ